MGRSFMNKADLKVVDAQMQLQHNSELEKYKAEFDKLGSNK